MPTVITQVTKVGRVRETKMNGTVTDSPNIVGPYSELYDVKVGQKGVKPFDALHPNPYSRNRQEISSLYCTYGIYAPQVGQWPGEWRKWDYEGYIIQIPSPTDFSFPTSRASLNEARGRYSKNMIGVRANWVENLGEYKEGLRVLANGGDDIIGATAKHLKSRSVKTLVREAKQFSKLSHSAQAKQIGRLQKNLANTHLEYQFAIKPIMSDVSETLKQIEDGPKLRFKITGTSQSNETAYLTQSVTHSSGAIVTFKWRAIRRTSYRLSSVLDEYDRNAFLPVEKLVGFNFDNLVPTLWELIPGSFLIDYVSNLQEIITSIMAKVYGSQGLYQTTFEKTLVSLAGITGTLQPSIVFPGRYYSSPPRFNRATASHIGVNLQRLTSGITTIPSLELQFPTDPQVLNIAALLVAKAHRVTKYADVIATPFNFGANLWEATPGRRHAR